MRQLVDRALKLVRRRKPIILIIEDDDIIELPGFAEKLADELGLGHVHIVLPTAKTIVRNGGSGSFAYGGQGVLIPRTDLMGKEMRKQLNRLTRDQQFERIIILGFPSTDHLEKKLAKWPAPLCEQLSKDRALQWPTLSKRKGALDAMINWFLTKFGEKKLNLKQGVIERFLQDPPQSMSEAFLSLADMACTEEDGIPISHPRPIPPESEAPPSVDPPLAWATS
ncbi:MAG: hypothetical protein NUV81_04215 [bacterium]|nr:hypothetical protein [bacterium]